MQSHLLYTKHKQLFKPRLPDRELYTLLSHWNSYQKKDLLQSIQKQTNYQSFQLSKINNTFTMPSSTATLNNVSEQLFHIKRTITDLSPDLSNSAHIVDILGTYTDLAAAKKAARRALFSEGYLANDFEIYEENNGDENWKYGDGVKAYAKAFAGQVFEVRIDTKPNTAGLKSEGEEEFEGELFYGWWLPLSSFLFRKKLSKLMQYSQFLKLS